MEPLITRLDTVQKETVGWLWPGRIPMNKLTILGGEYGMGKSFLTCAIAAIVSRGGRWPEGNYIKEEDTGPVVFLAAEDGLGDTIVPRLDSAGADLSQCITLEGWKGLAGVEEPDLKLHYRHLAEFCSEYRPKLLIVDPINNYLGEKVDVNSNVQVRKVLQPLVRMAALRKVTLLLVHHFNKQRNAELRTRLGGSAAFAENVRSAMGVLPGDTEEVRRLVMIKNNLTEKPRELRFVIEDGRVQWLNAAPIAEELFGGEPSVEVL